MHWSTTRLLSTLSQTQCVIGINYWWYCDQELYKTLQNSSWQRFFIEFRLTLDVKMLMFSKSSDWWMWCRRWLNLNGKLDNLLTVFFVYFISSSFIANSSKFQWSYPRRSLATNVLCGAGFTGDTVIRPTIAVHTIGSSLIHNERTL